MNPNFIDVYKDALTVEQCNSIIDWFEQSSDRFIEGKVTGPDGRYINKNIKDSTDLPVQMTSEYQFPSEIIFGAITKFFPEYLKKYPFLDKIDKFNLDVDYNLQRYYPGQGFHKEHCEHMNRNSTRVLAWTLYLNDITDGGETLYTLYEYSIKPKAGSIAFFPAYWTHAHKGITSSTQTKYIATGWFSFLRCQAHKGNIGD